MCVSVSVGVGLYDQIEEVNIVSLQRGVSVSEVNLKWVDLPSGEISIREGLLPLGLPRLVNIVHLCARSQNGDSGMVARRRRKARSRKGAT